MGGDPTTFVVSQTAHTPPGVVPPPLHTAARSQRRAWAKRPRYALDRSGLFGATSVAIYITQGRLRTPKGDRSVRAVFDDVTANDVRRAADRLRGIARRTELRHATRLSAVSTHDVWLKLENEQLTGSFKIRGAFNAVASLPPAERERGVVTASAGNHGRGVALAAEHFGISATIFVPCTAPRVKVDGIREYHASIDTGSAHYDEAHARSVAFATANGIHYLEPCSGAALVAGQGTVALEIVEQLPSVRSIVVPVGGGGLVGGMGAFLSAVRPDVRIIGAQSVNTNAMARALEADHIVDTPVLPTLADGLSGAIDEHGLDVGRHALDEIVTVEEADIANAIAFLAREERVVAEGSGAVGVAALLTGVVSRLDDPVVVVISGGNIDPDVLANILGSATAKMTE
jgi:threonine dehydratase